MRAGFRFRPGCLGQKKTSFNESVQVVHNGQVLRLEAKPNEQNDQNKDVTNDTDPGASASHGGRENSESASCSSEHRLKLSLNGMKKYTDQNQNILEKALHTDTVKTLHTDNMELGEKADILSHSHLKKHFCLDPFGSVNYVIYEGQSDPVCLEGEYRGGQSLNLNGPSAEDLDFSCQRVRVYQGKTSTTCARTYLTWPFLSREKRPEAAGNGDIFHISPFQSKLIGNEPTDPVCLEGEYRGGQSLNLNGLSAEDLDFSCQRVRVYQGKTSTTCARTYLTWPFLSREKRPEAAGNGDIFHISSFQSKLIGNEPTDPDQLPQQSSSISNQREGSKEKNQEETLNKTKDSVGLSSDFINITYINRPYSSHSSEQCVTMLPQKQNCFCKDIATAESPTPNNDNGRSTPSPSRLGLTQTAPIMFTASLIDSSSCLSSDSSLSSPVPTPALLSLGSSPVFTITLPQVHSLYGLDSNDSCDSPFVLPQNMEVSPDETGTSLSPPKLEPYFKTTPLIQKSDPSIDPDILLPPLLSPLNSPLQHVVSTASVESESKNGDTYKHKMAPENHTPEIHEVRERDHECGWQQNKTTSTYNDEELFSDTPPPPSAALNDSSSCPSCSESNGEPSTDKDSCTSQQSENQSPEEDWEKPEALDEIEAYEQDILLVDVFRDDPDLFENLPQKSILKLGPVKMIPPVPESSKKMQSVAPVHLDFLHSSEDSPRRSWRPQCTSALHSNTKKHVKITGSAEARVLNSEEERTELFPTENHCYNHISSKLVSRLGPRSSNSLSASGLRWPKPAYCRKYFSNSQSCVFKMCRFHHVPMEGDEKFCTETVARFMKTPACLHKAGAVFTSYYQNNTPGAFFSKPVLASLLRSLLQAGMLSDVFSVIQTSLTHNIVPEHEFLLDLFNIIREKNLVSFVPELVQLTFKMAAAGLPLSLDCLDYVKNTPQTLPSNSPQTISGHRSVTPSEHFYLAHAVVEMELCTKQQDWKRLGEVFKSICQSAQVSQVERISGRIAVALLSESKDRLTLPFAAFAETAGHGADEDGPVKCCLGRIGVSLMLRYHKTHQWAKGQKVVEVLSAVKVRYATMKGLFGNEDGTSRCCLVSVATELFLLNGSVEGALNTLRENEWFLTSSAWPCEAVDLEKRTHVLLCLAEKTSHRDTLEVLSNLPGLKEPNGHIDISKYTPFFTAHLQVCLDRQILVLASDLVDFMLDKNLPVDHAMLHTLLHKLGKQNFWLKAREIFKNSMSKGYHPEVCAPLGLKTLVVPSQLGEIELALTFEMFITMNATSILALPEGTSSTLTITLKRAQTCESEYLSAGSRLLSAASIPQPKLSVHYTGVNSSQEQVFTLDVSSARRWLRHNHLWANEVWTISV
ncbi:uncharacterized protein topaz1 [Periophthalmus magnuspinnatus]|uniref:uncharacterized protein topaz1 n=1 Tax=Periophthalmus magnuspinnatus TaxID=409849 RepID=UPI002436D08D|nr:uncharacterized protein topaz1 [Periophthalmus magnuspinnatus]XP_055081350.1 uncharacterized protein topaz1 [Periophthalmus magnuspinnatus]